VARSRALEDISRKHDFTANAAGFAKQTAALLGA
jgi:hypothetical protein